MESEQARKTIDDVPLAYGFAVARAIASMTHGLGQTLARRGVQGDQAILYSRMQGPIYSKMAQ